MRWATSLAIAVTLALGVSACGEDSKDSAASSDARTQEIQQPPEPETEPTEPKPVEPAYDEDDPEALLATIDNGGEMPDDIEIDRYARLLDKMERYCREDRSLLADQVVNGRQILKDEKDLDYTNLEMARAYSNTLTGKRGRNQKCSDLFAGVLLLTTAEE